MATRAVRESDRDWILLGLIAQGLDGWRDDWREHVLVLALHYDACGRIGASADAVFSEAADLLPPNVGRSMTSFLRRSPEDRTLEAMGYAVSADEDGFRYRRTW